MAKALRVGREKARLRWVYLVREETSRSTSIVGDERRGSTVGNKTVGLQRLVGSDIVFSMERSLVKGLNDFGYV
jgi:hypothetical protein